MVAYRVIAHLKIGFIDFGMQYVFIYEYQTNSGRKPYIECKGNYFLESAPMSDSR